MGRLGRKKKRARGERIARAFSIFSFIAIVIGLPRSLRGGNSVYLCKRKYSAGSRPWDKQIRPWGGGGGRSYIRLHSGKTSLTRENKADCSESSGCGDFNWAWRSSGRSFFSPPHSKRQKAALLAGWGTELPRGCVSTQWFLWLLYRGALTEKDYTGSASCSTL